MHEYYARNKSKFEKKMDSYLKLISPELEKATGLQYSQVLKRIWSFYEKELLEKMPYIGGDDVSGTNNLTGAYYFVAMGEVLKEYGFSVEDAGYLMVLSYQRTTQKLPGVAKPMMKFLMKHPSLLQKMFLKKDKKNRENAAINPGSFETKTLIPPEKGCIFSYRNLVCPLSDFAKKYGYEEYMPYLCNLDYVMFGELGVPLYRTHTCFEDGDYCDFNIRKDAEVLKGWPPVFTQGNTYK